MASVYVVFSLKAFSQNGLVNLYLQVSIHHFSTSYCFVLFDSEDFHLDFNEFFHFWT